MKKFRYTKNSFALHCTFARAHLPNIEKATPPIKTPPPYSSPPPSKNPKNSSGCDKKPKRKISSFLSLLLFFFFLLQFRHEMRHGVRNKDLKKKKETSSVLVKYDFGLCTSFSSFFTHIFDTFENYLDVSKLVAKLRLSSNQYFLKKAANKEIVALGSKILMSFNYKEYLYTAFQCLLRYSSDYFIF